MAERVAIVGSREHPDLRRVLVFGPRNFRPPQMVADLLFRVIGDGDVIMHGACPHKRNGAGEIVEYSVDALADEWAKEWSPNQPMRFPADWDRHGNPAGPIRNTDMANMLRPTDRWIGFWDGRSKGSFDMLKKAAKRCPGRLYVEPHPGGEEAHR